MVGYFMLLAAVVILFLVSGRVKLPKTREFLGWKIPFYKSAYFLVSLEKGKKNGPGISEREEEKRIEKLADMLLVLFLGLGLTLLVESVSEKPQEYDQVKVERPANGEGSQVRPFHVQIEGEEGIVPMEVTVNERQYTKAEKIGFLELAMEELDTMILGENTSPDKVQDKIVLPADLLDGKVSIQWSKEVEPENAVDEEGVISPDVPPEGVLLQLQGILVCQDQEAVYQRALYLFPPDRNPLEQLLYELQKNVEAEERRTAEEENFSLPEEIDGKEVVWQEKKSSTMGVCLLLTLTAAAAAYFGKEQEFHKREQQRRQQLIMDYPGLLFQLSMLLEAGLTMQNAFCKIALDYRERRTRECRFVYEEMLISCYEMQSGVSERKAYEDFGRRCGENSYVRLGTMLSGSLQKGAQGLTVILKEEAQTAMEVRRQLAKKLGEEAGTKLLMPMMLMLVVVLVILMVPAVMSF